MTYFTMILLNLILGGQPYALTVERVTPALADLCRLDDNCMDLKEIQVGGCGGDMDCERRGAYE